jgi:hypothetical protein
MGKDPVYGWYSKFNGGYKKLLNLLGAHVQLAALCEMNVLSRFLEINELQFKIFLRTVI